VNFVLHFPHHAGIQVCIDEQVAALSFFWGDPSEFVAPAHDAGITVLHQVASVEAAVRAQQAGVDVIIAQGTEAGGHVAGEVSTMVLLPRIVDAVAPALVLAAGGIADARGLAAALCLGAAASSWGRVSSPLLKRMPIPSTKPSSLPPLRKTPYALFFSGMVGPMLPTEFPYDVSFSELLTTRPLTASSLRLTVAGLRPLTAVRCWRCQRFLPQLALRYA